MIIIIWVSKKAREMRHAPDQVEHLLGGIFFRPLSLEPCCFSHLVITVHQPDNVTDILLRARSHHLTAGTVDRSHDLPGAGGLLVLHALPAHHEGLALVIFLGGEDKVPG